MDRTALLGMVLALLACSGAQKTVLSTYTIRSVSTTYTLQLDGSLYVEERLNLTFSLRASTGPTDYANSLGPGRVEAERAIALRNYVAAVDFRSVRGQYGTPDPHFEIRSDDQRIKWWISTPDMPATSLDASYVLTYIKRNALASNLHGAGVNVLQENVLGDEGAGGGWEVPVGSCQAEVYLPLQLDVAAACETTACHHGLLVQPPPARTLNISYAPDAPLLPDFGLVNANTTTLLASGTPLNMTWVQIAPRFGLPAGDACGFRIEFPLFVATFPQIGLGTPRRLKPVRSGTFK